MTSFAVALRLWSVFAVVWVAMSFGRKRAVRKESAAASLAQWVYMGAAFTLLFRHDLELGLLTRRFLPEGAWVAALGILLTALGIGFAIWARLHLGRQWSGDVTIREDHELIATGPYARIRHPIYTGILTGMLGTALIVGEWRGLLAVLIATIGFSFKAKREERFLVEEFGPAFEEHRRRTGFLLPRLGGRPQSSSSV
jgi:protein-S-isoprenylcysteine O-methyltransferase Ste14